MTCIVGIEAEDGIYIGGDRAAVGGSNIETASAPKIFRKKDFIYGFAGSFRQGQVLQYVLEEPANNRKHVMEYLLKDYIPMIRLTFEDEGILITESETNEESIDSFILAYRDTLYIIDEDLHVNTFECKYLSIGIGSEYAIGSLHTTRRHKKTKNRIDKALKAASAHCPGVMPPFDIIFVSKEDRKNKGFPHAMQVVK